jgi:hypothetical protein
MTCWNPIFEVEQVKKLPLVTRLSTHHDPSPPLNEPNSSRESCRAPNHEPFFDNIDPFRTCQVRRYPDMTDTGRRISACAISEPNSPVMMTGDNRCLAESLMSASHRTQLPY